MEHTFAQQVVNDAQHAMDDASLLSRCYVKINRETKGKVASFGQLNSTVNLFDNFFITAFITFLDTHSLYRTQIGLVCHFKCDTKAQ